MSERREPDLDQVREALREHDERVEEDARAAPRPDDESTEEDDADEQP